MSIFDEMLSKVSDTGTKVTDSAKLKLKQKNLEDNINIYQDKINDRLMLIGAAVFDELEAGNEVSSYEEIRTEINSLYAEKLDLQNQLDMLIDTSVRCESCNGLFDKSNDYCPYCGHKR